MSQQSVYPMASTGVLHGDHQSLESQSQKADCHTSLLENQTHSIGTVAQLPVMVAETHQVPNIFPRSVSMPLPNNNNNANNVASQSDSLSTGGDQLLTGLNSNNEFKSATVAKIEHIRNWSISTYKCTKQIISEKLGKSSRTVDTELESQIDLLRDVQRKYLNILRLSRALSSHFQHVVVTQVKVRQSIQFKCSLFVYTIYVLYMYVFTSNHVLLK